MIFPRAVRRRYRKELVREAGRHDRLSRPGPVLSVEGVSYPRSLKWVERGEGYRFRFTSYPQFHVTEIDRVAGTITVEP